MESNEQMSESANNANTVNNTNNIEFLMQSTPSKKPMHT